MKHIQKLRKLILTLGILAGMGMTAYAEGETITVTWKNTDFSGQTHTKDGVTINDPGVVTKEGSEVKIGMYQKNWTFTSSLGNFTKIKVEGGWTFNNDKRFRGVGNGWNDRTWTGNSSSVSAYSVITDANGSNPWTITFTIKKVNVTSVSLDKTTTTLTVGNTETLTATVSPDNASDKSVTWSSDNTSVATVDANGKVTAVAVGTANITVTATNGTEDTSDDKTATCAVTVTANKSALNTAITAAETLYISIRNNTDYSNIASALEPAINAAKGVAESDTAAQNDVDAATTAITTAKTKAEADKKDVDDTTEANKVSTLIEDLPAKEAITKDDSTKVEAAKAAYDALTDDQKKKVSDANKQKLNDAIAAIEKDKTDTAAANTVIAKINALPATAAITSANKDAIEAARAAYDALTDDQKAKISDTVKNKLKAAETAVVAAEFNEYKKAQKTAAENKAQGGDSDATIALITAAKATIDALTYDATKTLDENKAAVTAVVTQLATDLANQRAAEQPVTVAAKADPSTTGTYYSTFYDSTKSYAADCEVYYATANADGRLTLQKAEGNVIKAGEGVILKATSETVTLTPTTTKASYDSLLTGSDSETTVENVLVLSLGKNGVWFYKYSGKLGANKAYLAQ